MNEPSEKKYMKTNWRCSYNRTCFSLCGVYMFCWSVGQCFGNTVLCRKLGFRCQKPTHSLLVLKNTSCYTSTFIYFHTRVTWVESLFIISRKISTLLYPLIRRSSPIEWILREILKKLSSHTSMKINEGARIILLIRSKSILRPNPTFTLRSSPARVLVTRQP